MKHTVSVAAVLAALALVSCQKSEDRAANAAAPAEPSSGQQVVVADLKPCAVLGNRRVTEEDCGLAQETDKSVTDGLAAFNWPQEMRRGKQVVLRLAVGEAPAPQPTAAPQTPANSPAVQPDTSAAASPAAPQAPPPAGERGPVPAASAPPSVTQAVSQLPGQTVTYSPLIGRYMSARLTGDSFDIVAQSSEHQEVLPDSVTHWDWLVTPKSGGAHELTITTQVEFKDAAGNYVPLRFRPETRKIEVKVPWWLFILDLFDALPTYIKALAGVLTALATLSGAAWALWRAIRGKGKSQPNSYQGAPKPEANNGEADAA